MNTLYQIKNRNATKNEKIRENTKTPRNSSALSSQGGLGGGKLIVIGGELPVHTFLRGVSCSSPRFEQSSKQKKTAPEEVLFWDCLCLCNTDHSVLITSLLGRSKGRRGLFLSNKRNAACVCFAETISNRFVSPETYAGPFPARDASSSRSRRCS
ncbi:MAG: hypothetical protein IIZ00_02490, partial [Oscillospiraceae bacterium]|nr:hypothetical protein [Oscillospiraceae bacterium]